MRAHFTRPVTDEKGDLLPNVQVSVFEPATTDLVSQVLYSTDTGNNILNNPFVSSTGVIDLYLDAPARVRFGVVQGNLPMQFYEDVDVLAAGADSPHTGAGPFSLVIGDAAVSAGDSSTAVGPAASSGGTNSVAVGKSANSLGEYSTAVGSGAIAQDISTTAVGRNATALGDQGLAVGNGAQTSAMSASALGDGANAPFTRSTAIGAGSVTTSENQVMLGAPGDIVEVPLGSGIILTSPNETRWLITVDDNGTLVSTMA